MIRLLFSILFFCLFFYFFFFFFFSSRRRHTRFDCDWSSDVCSSDLSEEHLDVAAARAVLDADHTGLDDVKDRILEYLAVRKLRTERGLSPVGGRGSGAIITLVGPPGVGKTSLGESVARALGRNFVRMS